MDIRKTPDRNGGRGAGRGEPNGRSLRPHRPVTPEAAGSSPVDPANSLSQIEVEDGAGRKLSVEPTDRRCRVPPVQARRCGHGPGRRFSTRDLSPSSAILRPLLRIEAGGRLETPFPSSFPSAPPPTSWVSCSPVIFAGTALDIRYHKSQISWSIGKSTVSSPTRPRSRRVRPLQRRVPSVERLT